MFVIVKVTVLLQLLIYSSFPLTGTKWYFGNISLSIPPRQGSFTGTLFKSFFFLFCTLMTHVIVWWSLTCKVHLVLEGIGNSRNMKASYFTDSFLQWRHLTTERNWPWNSVTMMDLLSIWWFFHDCMDPCKGGRLLKSSSFTYCRSRTCQMRGETL